MKMKQLEGLLGDLQQFSNPKAFPEKKITSFVDVELEQYPTGPHIASHMLFTVNVFCFRQKTDKVVAVFGCGTLNAAASLLYAACVFFFDIDPQSLETATLNADELEVCLFLGQVVDTVVMNPPFGTRKKGADMEFLSAAMKVASQAVYSLHKTSTREHIKRAALRDFKAKSAELWYDLPKLYKFHKRKEVDIAVDLWRFEPRHD
ncbi:unnamed protein product [Eruca vesicaria subsp. sativa]|uniref:Uncharacterized protein n=1 Tax=Eruca vesicaria subsp. sativa TaxID=29727 RepID=A0ABC8KJE7_ERUVS|nr:unnamed protein product [Eruca vesicaria subsp. sativa]